MGDVSPRAILSRGTFDDLVVDVGDVRHETYLDTPISEVTTKDVVDERGSTMAKMRRAIHGGATEIDADLARLAQLHFTNLSRCGVVQVQHAASLEPDLHGILSASHYR